MVVQQVHLVYVEDAAVRSSQYSGLERTHPLFYRFLDVERANDPILSASKREIDYTGSSRHTLKFFAVFRTLIADVAHLPGICRITVEWTAVHDFNLGK